MPDADVDMRDAFFDAVYEAAARDTNVIVLTADHAAFSLTRLQRDFPRQYFNAGIAEQNMVSVAAGLALSGKTVFVYTIVNFLTLRCLEHISVDVASMNLPVCLVGVGRGFTYSTDGPTHQGTHDVAAVTAIPNMSVFVSSDPCTTRAFAQKACREPGPKYILIEKGRLPALYSGASTAFTEGLALLKPGDDLTIIATGAMVHRALDVAGELERRGSWSVGVIDLYRLKPLNAALLLSMIANTARVVTLEENGPIGGMGSMICTALMDHGRCIPVKRMSLGDAFCFQYHLDRNWMLDSCGLGRDQLVSAILNWVGGPRASGDQCPA